MAYNEQDFLNGLAAGLTATAGPLLVRMGKTLLTGTGRVSNPPEGNFDTFVSKIRIRTSFPVTLLYEYGPADGTLTREARRVGASEETQTVYHVCQTPTAVPFLSFRYGAYLMERAYMNIGFEARFMTYPYSIGDSLRPYPGSPELVSVWLSTTYRRREELTQ